MTGYRDRSSFDPYGAASRPARPFNAVQWLGAALLAASVALNVAFLAGEAGWLPKWNATPALATDPMIFGVLLMNSRREPSTDLAPELRPARRRWMLGTIAIVGIILTVAAIIDLSGAK
ncbi:MAG: hypothetical protein ACJ8FS_12485 [Sphingomicrobium sp.]